MISRYEMKIRLEASAVPETLGLWLAEALPVDYRVMYGHTHGMRVTVIGISGSSPEDVDVKRVALMETVRAAGFDGLTLDDVKPCKKVKSRTS